MGVELHRKKDHFVKFGILIARYTMVNYIDLENGLQKKHMHLYLFAINKVGGITFTNLFLEYIRVMTYPEI